MRRLFNNIGVFVGRRVHDPAPLVAVLDEAQTSAGSRPAVAR
jgi:hypothetical protein